MKIQRISDNQQTFGVRIKNRQIKGVVREAKDVSKPFLRRNATKISHIYTLRVHFEKALKALDNYIKIPKYNTADFKEVKRLRLGEIDSLLQEYFYLSDKSESWYVTPDVAEYAKEIRSYFNVPDCLNEQLCAYKQLQNDIKNGLKGRNFPKNLKEKFNGLNEGSRKLALLTSPYNSVEHENANISKYLSMGVKNIDLFRRSLDNINDSVDFHNKHLSVINQRISQADSLYKQNLLTKEDLELIGTNPQQKIISRCVSKFNKKVAGVSLTEEDNIAIDKRLKQQEEVLEILYNKIEVCKKNTFSPKPQQEVSCNYPEGMPF